MTDRVDADYLVVGAGASGMAFADAIVDRIIRNAHRMDLHEPSMENISAENINITTVDHLDLK